MPFIFLAPTIYSQYHKSKGVLSMSARKTGDRAIHVSAGTFPTYEDAVKEANAVKIWLTRLCRRKGYSCKATIGVSKNNPHTGEVTRERTGRRGRPKNVFVRTNEAMVPTGTDPHLHIIIHGNPAETLAREIAEHINKKYGRRVAWVKNCSAYVETVKRYIAKQSLKTRTVDCWNGDRYCNEQEGGFLFTLTETAGTPQSGEESRLDNIEQASNGLQYKANYNFSATLSKDYAHNISTFYTYPPCKSLVDTDTYTYSMYNLTSDIFSQAKIFPSKWT